MRRASAVCVLAFALLSSGCVSPPRDEDEVPTFRSDTEMGEIQADAKLIVGIDPDLPPFSFVGDGAPSGFLVEVAEEVAASLGVEAEFRTMASDLLLGAPDVGDVDLAFPAIPITEQLVRRYTFANPYYVAHQRLLVESGSGIDGVGDLAGKKVCQAIDPRTGVDLTDHADVSRIRTVLEPPNAAVCVAAVRRGLVDAATAADLFLLRGPVETAELDIVGDQLTTEGFAPHLETGATGMADWVSAVLGEAKAEGRYMSWYEEWIAPYLNDPITKPPTMTIEEAAALFPEEA